MTNNENSDYNVYITKREEGKQWIIKRKAVMKKSCKHHSHHCNTKLNSCSNRLDRQTTELRGMGRKPQSFKNMIAFIVTLSMSNMKNVEIIFDVVEIIFSIVVIVAILKMKKR